MPILSFPVRYNSIKASIHLKLLLTTSPILALFDPDKQIFIEADASKYSHGSIMSQEGDDKRLHPVECHASSFSPAQRNYDVSDKEMLAIIGSDSPLVLPRCPLQARGHHLLRPSQSAILHDSPRLEPPPKPLAP